MIDRRRARHLSLVEGNCGFVAKGLGFEPWFFPFSPVKPWVSFITSLDLNFLIYKIKILNYMTSKFPFTPVN